MSGYNSEHRSSRRWITIALTFACILLSHPALSIEPEFQPAVVIEQVQFYRDGGTVGIELSDANQRSLSFCLDQQLNSPTAGRVYVRALHPSDPDAVLVSQGGAEERAILTLLRAWLGEQIPLQPAQRQMITTTNDSIEKRMRTLHIIQVVQEIQDSFEDEPDLIDPAYNCFDMHGDFQCFAEFKMSATAAMPSVEVEGFVSDFGCQSDADCYATREGGCVTGQAMAETMGDQIIDGNPANPCRCLTGPVMFGCVPENSEYNPATTSYE